MFIYFVIFIINIQNLNYYEFVINMSNKNHCLKHSQKKKAQSAMEYLMTYGWAILIIAVVLAALDMLGIFNGATFLGTSCLSTPGYECSSPLFSAVTASTSNNLLTFNFTQTTGHTMYNIAFACAASANAISGLPNIVGGSGTEFSTISFSVLPSGGSGIVSGLVCYTSNGNVFASHPIGTPFAGQIWVQYNQQQGAGKATLIAIIAKLTAKVSVATSSNAAILVNSLSTICSNINCKYS